MGKFNVNSIRGYDKIKDIKEDVSGEEYKFGSGLLSDASKDVVKMNIVNIEREKINKNPKNKYQNSPKTVARNTAIPPQSIFALLIICSILASVSICF